MPGGAIARQLFLTYLIAAVVAFVSLAVIAKTVAYFTFDVTITRAVQTFNAGWFDAIMRVLTWIGFAPQAWMITLVYSVVPLRERSEMGDCGGGRESDPHTALGLGIKVLVDRPRPSADLVTVINQLKDYSFPSGHVLFFTTFFGFLLFLAYTLLKHSWWRTGLLILLVGMIALIGPSRIYVGQHWASDVIAAYLLGSIWLAFSVLIYRWGKPRFFVNQPVAKETPVSAKPSS